MSKSTAAVKPPVGIKPKKLHDLSRVNDIYLAMGRYIDAEKQIPAEWAKELIELSKSTFKK